jgi:hypothetical protein
MIYKPGRSAIENAKKCSDILNANRASFWTFASTGVESSIEAGIRDRSKPEASPRRNLGFFCGGVAIRRCPMNFALIRSCLHYLTSDERSSIESVSRMAVRIRANYAARMWSAVPCISPADYAIIELDTWDRL